MATIQLTNIESLEVLRMGIRAKYGDRFDGCVIKRANTDYLQFDIVEPDGPETTTSAITSKTNQVVIRDKEIINGTGRKIRPLPDDENAA